MPPSFTLADLPGGPVVFLTGAGISAESGVPTFRGPEGYWRIGSRNYRPMELATRAAFEAMPEQVWRWYLFRRGVCRAAQPNPAHLALVQAEAALAERFLLVTQNVDGLHLRAGQSPGRTYQIHGNIDFHRCTGCGRGPLPLPAALGEAWPAQRTFGAPERALLTCSCGAWMRPHVLWFDESYDEPLFRLRSTQAAIEAAAALVVIGTSGATSLPAHMVQVAADRGIALVIIDQERTPFVEVAEACPRGAFLQGPAGLRLPPFVTALTAQTGDGPGG
jgi:NAD-dependent deacetylase